MNACGSVHRGGGAFSPFERQLRGFPWFWVVFPFTCLAAGVMILGFLPDSTPSPGSGPNRYVQGDGAPVDYFTVLNWLNAVSAASVTTGAVLAVWAWRKRRM